MSKYEIITINNKFISIDISDLIKKENIFFNATEIAKHFGKLPKDYLENKTTKIYINTVSSVRGIPLTELVNVKQGGTKQGTWLHQYIAIDFARWVNPEFAVHLDEWIVNKLQEEKYRKQERSLARLEYPDLTDAIQEFLVTGKDSDKWLYAKEADLINIITLGCKAKKYCELNGIDRVQLRDNLSTNQISLIQQLQRFDKSLIQAGLDYQTRKDKLRIRYAQLVNKLLK